MQKPSITKSQKEIGVLISAMVLLFATFSQPAGATTADDVCNKTPGNECTPDGVCHIRAETPIADESVLDFNALECPTVIVHSAGKLALETKLVGQDDIVCSSDPEKNKPSTWMAIRAGDLTIENGGEITGSYPEASGRPSALLNAGAIYIGLTHEPKPLGGTTGANLIIAPGGKLTSDREAHGNGESGKIGLETEGQIDVQATDDGLLRGLISSNSDASSVFAFNRGCGLPEITLIAKGDNAPLNEAIRIAGTVEIAAPHLGVHRRVEDFMGGLVTMLGGAEKAFPGAFTQAFNFQTSLPVRKPNPPEDAATVHVTETGLVNVNALDHGGGEVRVAACFVFINGLIQVGGDAHTGRIEGRETQLPTLVEIIAHEDIKIMPAVGFETWLIPGVALTPDVDVRGGVRADVRAGFRQHIGQGLTDPDPVARMGKGCEFTPLAPPQSNRPLNTANKGGADVCLLAGHNIEIDSKLSPEFAVRARTGKFNNLSSSGQTGGTILALTTREGGDISLTHKALTASGYNSSAKGGLVVVQATHDVEVKEPVDSSGNIEANDGGVGKAVGGRIELEATNGELLQEDGLVLAIHDGVIGFRECIVADANDPQSTPPASKKPPMCGEPQLVSALPVLLPCVGCSCITSVSLRDSIVTINGSGLKEVRQVAFAPTCAPDDQCKVNAPFLEQSDSTIKLALPSFCIATGDHVIVGDPGIDSQLGTPDDVSPSISCSRDTYPF